MLDRVFRKQGIALVVTDSLYAEVNGKPVRLYGETDGNAIYVGLRDGKRNQYENQITVAAFHELYHWMRYSGQIAEGVQRKITENMIQTLKADKKYNYDEIYEQRAKVYDNLTQEEIEEEIAAQYFGTLMADRLSGRQVLQGIDKGVIEKIIDHLRAFLEQVHDAIAEFAKRTNDKAMLAALQTDMDTAESLLGMYENLLRGAISERMAAGETSGQERTEGETTEKKYSFAGVGSATADRTMLQQAEQMEKDGADSEMIRKETGWFKGYDGKWRYEIDDSKMKFDLNGLLMRNPDVRRYNELMQKFLYDMPTQEEIAELKALEPNLKGVRMKPETLGDMIEHSALLEAYPKLADIPVIFGKLDDASGAYYPNSNEIYIHENLLKDTERLKKTLLHEVQHAIQHIEGFASGSNEFYWAGVISKDEIRKKAETEIRHFLDDVPKKLQNKYYRYIELDRVLTELLLADGDLDEEKYDHYDKIQDDLYEELYQYDWFKRLQYAEQVLRDPGEAYKSLYKRTAGEVEARDTAARADLTAEQRKETRPDIDRTDVVFADGSGTNYEIKYDKNNKPYWYLHTEEHTNKFEKCVTADDFVDVAYSILFQNRDYDIVYETIDGKKVEFIRLSADEFTHGKLSNEILASGDDNLYKKKMMLAPSIGEILLNSTTAYHTPDHKEHKLFKEKGFQNYRGRFRIDDIIFTSIVRVGLAKTGNYFYDIKIEVGEYLPHSDAASDIKEKPTSKKNIPQTETESQGVKHSRALDQEYMVAVEDGDEETQARLVEQAARAADTITYGDNGNVISLSERFNPEKEDIRYSRALDVSASKLIVRDKRGNSLFEITPSEITDEKALSFLYQIYENKLHSVLHFVSFLFVIKLHAVCFFRP